MQKMNGRLAIICVFIAAAHAWGPFSHYFMSCSSLFDEDVIPCLQNQLQNAQAMELPDAFFFAGKFVTGTKCLPTLDALHDPVFAGYWYLNATSQAEAQFALSFGSHPIADLAGFLTFYLSPIGPVYWTPVWQFMLAQDAYQASLWNSSSAQKLVQSVSKPISQNVAQWVASATQMYNKIVPTFPVATANEILECSRSWSQVIATVGQEALLNPPSSFQQQMSFYDLSSRNISNPTSAFNVAQTDYNTFTTCGKNAVTMWKNAITSNVSPKEAVAQVQAYVATCGKKDNSIEISL